MTEYERTAITNDAERAAKLGHVPAWACPYNHKDQREQHRLWMAAYQAKVDELGVGRG